MTAAPTMPASTAAASTPLLAHGLAHLPSHFRVMPYEPRGGVRELIVSKEPFVLVEGPSGTGKTLGCGVAANLRALTYPGCRILFCRATRASLTDSVLPTFEREVLRDMLPQFGDASAANRHSYVYPNGSEIVCGGMDSAARVMSTDYDFIFLFEATEITEAFYEKCATRLFRINKAPYNQLIADCNPGPETHWLNQRAAAGKMRRILSRFTDNPSITPQRMAMLDSLTGVQRKRYFDGVWCSETTGLSVFDGSGLWWIREHLAPRCPPLVGMIGTC